MKISEAERDYTNNRVLIGYDPYNSCERIEIKFGIRNKANGWRCTFASPRLTAFVFENKGPRLTKRDPKA